MFNFVCSPRDNGDGTFVHRFAYPGEETMATIERPDADKRKFVVNWPGWQVTETFRSYRAAYNSVCG